MPDSKSEELLYAKRLRYENKFMESLEIVKKLEEEGGLNDQDQLTIHILKGRIFAVSHQYENAVKEGDRAFRLSQSLGKISESITALLLQSHIVFLGQFDEALNFALEGEKLLNSLVPESSSDLSGKRASLLHIKTWIYYFKGDYNLALEQAKYCLVLREKMGGKLNIAYTLLIMGYIYTQIGELNIALEHGMKCLWLFEELDNQPGISQTLALNGRTYYNMGDLDQAIKFSRKSLMIKEFSIRTRASIDALSVLGLVYQTRGELDQALDYFKQAVEIAEQEHINDLTVFNSMYIGINYRMKGEYNAAIEYLEKCLKRAEVQHGVLVYSLLYLVYINRDKNAYERALVYMNRLKELNDLTESKLSTQAYSITKVLMLKSNKQLSSHIDTQSLLAQVIKDDIFNPQLFVLALISLCDLFLGELRTSNDPEALNKIELIISRLYKTAERQHSHLWLAETKLLQAKLALIQMKIEEAKKLLTQSQRIAELHGLNLLAMKISSEHDNLLKQVDVWKTLKIKNAPMSERVKLASFDGVVERLSGKRSIEPPELSPEVPVLILIIVEGGIPIFSYPFTKELSFEEDVVGSFLTAFNSFSSELFSKGLDRAKFGDYTILMDSIDSFSICYLFKGQTYSAKQKLSQFTDHIQTNKSIWEPLNRSYHTSETLEIKDNPSIESLISEVFLGKITN